MIKDVIKKQELPVENISTKAVGTRGQLKLPKFEIMKFDKKTLLNGRVFMIRMTKL